MHNHEAGTLHTLSNNGQANAYYLTEAPQPQAMLICLHGLASNASRWYEYLHHSQLRDHCHLAAMDLRGHGRALTYHHYTRADWCADLDRILRQFDLPAFLIGHSLGAQIALQYASQANTTPAGMVLIDPVFPQALTGTLRKVARLRVLVRAAAALLRLVYKLGWRKRDYSYRDLHQLDLDTRAFLTANPDKGIADLYMDPFADLEFIPLVNYLQDLYEVTRPLPSLAGIHTPILVLLSAGASTSHVDTNREILSELPNCEIRTVDADHWLLTERPVQAREIIDGWIRNKLNSFV
jgi:pimeloyl-ACP methyl ester carboxylesterase